MRPPDACAGVPLAPRIPFGAAAGSVPSGTSVSVPNTIGMTVAAINIITVPETTGVNMRRSSESRAARRNWSSDDTTMRLAIVDGPPFNRAATQTAMKAPDVPMMSTCPAHADMVGLGQLYQELSRCGTRRYARIKEGRQI